MTPEQEGRLLAAVENIEKVLPTLVTNDQCEARRGANGLARAAGALATMRQRMWTLACIFMTGGITGLVTWIVNH